MNTWIIETFGDSLLIWGAAVLLQWTLVAAAVLALGAFLRRQPVVRYGVLCSGLLMVLIVPLVAGAMQGIGAGMLSVTLINDSPQSATAVAQTASPPLKQENALPPATEPKASTSGKPPAELPLAVASTNGSTPTDSPTVTPNWLAPSIASRIGRLIRAVMPTLLSVWLAGTLLLFVRLTNGWRRMAAILRSATPNTNGALAAAFAGVSKPSGAELVISARVSGPMAAGLWRPRVIFPANLVERLTLEQARTILLHEMAHLMRRDQLVVLLQNLAAALCWFHPLIVMLNRQLAQAREEVCDNYVLADIDAPSYGRTLLTLAELIQTARPLLGSVGFFTSQWTLESRVAGLLDKRRSCATCLTVRGKIVVAALAFVLAWIATLGIVERTAAQPLEAQAADNAAAKNPDNAKAAVLRKGRITNAQGEPVAGAFVAVVGANITKDYKRQALAEGVADAAGRYELTLPGVSPKTHRDVSVIARADKMAIAWQHIDLTVPESQIDLKLTPERLIQVRLIDLQGKPAANIAVELTSIVAREGKGNDRNAVGFWQIDPKPQSALPRPTTDSGGLLTIPGIPSDHGVGLAVVGSEQFARQDLRLNTGEPEERLAHDGTYRATTKNMLPGQIATIPLAPATIFEGVVLLGETGLPAANSPIKIWASQQKEMGSMVSVDGKTDARGRFKLNPYAGVRFGIAAYPPPDAPYFPRRVEDLQWKPVDGSKSIEIRLPAAVLASGAVIDGKTGIPLPGAFVQYLPESENNKYATDDVVTGWQNMKHTDDQGRYKITVPLGPGTLLVHAPAGASYILQEKTEREIWAAKPGGKRYYAHAFQSIAPPLPNAKVEATSNFAVDPIKLRPGDKVVVKLVDADGKAIEHAVAISRLKISPHSLYFQGNSNAQSGSAIEIHGLEKEKQYSFHFLDAKRRLGATAIISGNDPQPTITLKPCASARFRLLQPDGKPYAGFPGSLMMVVTPGTPFYDLTNRAAIRADEDFNANFDQINYGRDHATDKNGVLLSPALIPGATYRFLDMDNGKIIVAREFVAESGKLHDLGDITLRSKQ